MQNNKKTKGTTQSRKSSIVEEKPADKSAKKSAAKVKEEPVKKSASKTKKSKK